MMLIHKIMNNSMKKYIFISTLAFLMFTFFPVTVHQVQAQCIDDVGESCEDDSSTAVEITNPLGDVNTIWGLVDIVINLVQTVMIPLVVLFLIYSGFLFVTARGSEIKLTKAKTVFMYTIIGTAIIIGAEAISLLIQGTINDLGTGI